MHSLDYRVIEKANTMLALKLFILPYNTIFPRTKAGGYTMEYRTLDENFVLNCGKQINCSMIGRSTINSIKIFRLNVDGIITDMFNWCKVPLKSWDNQNTDLLLNKAFDFFNFIQIAPLSNELEGASFEICLNGICLQRHLIFLSCGINQRGQSWYLGCHVR